MNPPLESFRVFLACAVLLLPGCGDAGSAGGADGGEPPAGAQATPDEAAPGQPAPGGRAPAPQEGASATQEPRQPVDLSALGHDEGDHEAVVRVIEFSDFGCVYCAGFHIESYPALHDEFIEAGDVIWKYIPVTIGGFPNGDAAALAGECAAEQGRFAEMRDRLFEVREEWMRSEDVAGMLSEEAGGLGLEVEPFRTCLEEGEEARTRLGENNRIAQQIGVRATPTFIVQGHPVEGAPPLDAFQQVLRELVAEARDPGR